MIRTRFLFVLSAAVSFCTAPMFAQHAGVRVNSSGGTSPHETTSTVIGDRRTGDRITLTYGRPYSADPKTGEKRKIWGALVPWDKPYRLGADEATLLITQQPLQFGPTRIPAGAYTLYLVPSASGTTQLAFSSAIGKWGVPVDTSHDVARVDMTRSALPTPVDQLTLGTRKDPATGGGALTVRWETTEFAAPFTIAK